MRKYFSELIEKKAKEDKNIVFITGDLGYNALENLQAAMGDRFINAGVAEQNMIGMAAGMAHRGYTVFCYSIAPFIVYRALEQVRLDVCLHKLPVFLVGNGGGYGYGIMGATHHAIEDIACLSSLPNMSCWVPAFKEDVSYCLDQILVHKQPAYLRLGAGFTSPFPNAQERSFATVKKAPKPAITVVALGPVINNVAKLVHGRNDIDLFKAMQVPLNELPEEFMLSLIQSGRLLVIEEHVLRGGLAESLSERILEHNIPLKSFKSLHALGYPGGLYGSQQFHQHASKLDAGYIESYINSTISHK